MKILVRRSVIGIISLFIILSYVSWARGQREQAKLLSTASGKEWSQTGGDETNERYSTLTQINVQNVKTLGATWVSKPFLEGGTSRVTPVVKDGLMYVTSGSRVYALNPKTGEVAWNYQTDSRPTPSGLDPVLLSRHGIPNTQGVAVGEGKIFVGLTDGRLIAIDEKTGEMLWDQQIGDTNTARGGQAIDAPPTYARGMVFAGIANGDWGLRGRVVAVDAQTGREMWHFFTVPGPGEPGHETWAQDNNAYKIGGGGIWLAGAADPDLGLVYYGTGNTVPAQGGELRPGNNLFTCSVLALDIKTGKLRWYYQVVHHDLWDGDIAVPLVLYDAQVGGQTRKAVAAMRADGWLFLLDRETGKPIIPVEERPVPQNSFDKTSATQPYPVGATSLLPQCASEWKALPAGFVPGCVYTPPSNQPPSTDPPNILAPGMFGVRVAPMSYSPQTGYFYVQGNASLAWRRRTQDPYYMLLGVGGHVPGLTSSSVVGAIDSKTDKVVWKKEIASGRGGAISTAGGLMFRSAGDGNFTAYDAKTGDLLWQFQTGVATPGHPSTYEVDGEQYVAVAAGSSVWAFKLGGTIPPRAAPRMPSPEAFTGPIDDTDQIDTASDLHNNENTGNRFFTDEFTFNPYRTRVKAGTTVSWTNNGQIRHTIEAMDGSWTTGPIDPGLAASVVFDKPGTYDYICKEHPWSYGEIIVTADTAQNTRAAGPASESQPSGGSAQMTRATRTGSYTDEQAKRGRAKFDQSCSSCHGADLSGNDPAPALAGDAFLQRWAGSNVRELYDKIRTTMPQTSPGSLTPQTYLDIVAYLLQSNNFPSGTEEMHNPMSLTAIPMDRK